MFTSPSEQVSFLKPLSGNCSLRVLGIGKSETSSGDGGYGSRRRHEIEDPFD